MEQSILTSTKKILGLSADDDAFDLDVTTHINTAISSLTQLGIGPAEGFTIEDAEAKWADFLPQLAADPQLNTAKTYVFLKVRMLFDLPATSFQIAAYEKQLEEYEWRLQMHREGLEWTDPNPPVVTVDE